MRCFSFSRLTSPFHIVFDNEGVYRTQGIYFEINAFSAQVEGVASQRDATADNSSPPENEGATDVTESTDHHHPGREGA
jgi:hypothetical protein